MATKRKKVFALALALSMALSLMSVTAFADEEGTGGTITVKAGESTALTGYAISSGSTVLENERWVSGDLDIATVQVENGTVTVTGVSAGTTTITHYYDALSTLEPPVTNPGEDDEEDSTEPEGGVTKPEGGVTKPEGGVTEPEGGVTKPEGGVTKPEGGVTEPEGGVTEPESTVTEPEGTVTNPEGTVTNPEAVTDFEGTAETQLLLYEEGPDEQLSESWTVIVTARETPEPPEEEQPDFGELTDSGEGWEWYGETGTLVLTKDTGDYDGSGTTVYPWRAYIAEMVSLYAKDITVGKYAFYAMSGRTFSKLECVTFEGCVLSEFAFNGGSYSYLSPELTTITLRDCTLEKGCIKNTRNLSTLVIENCGDIPAWTFQNLNAPALDLTITGSGAIGGGAFSDTEFSSVTITGGKLEMYEEEYQGDIYYTPAFYNISWVYGEETTMTLDGVTIPESGFEWNDMPTNLVARNCTIGSSAFTDAYTMPNSITLENCQVGSGAFHNPNNPNALTSLSVTGGTIGQMAFMGSESLSNLTLNSVTSIGGHAFAGCDALTSVTIGGPTMVGNYAFGGCDGLTSVVLDGDVTLEQRAFAECQSITSFTIQNTTQLRGTLKESVPESAVLTLPENLTFIDNSYFSGCLALKGELDLTGVKYIGYQAFNNCDNITKLIVDDDAKLGYSTIFPKVIDDWQGRVGAILAGRFLLDDASAIATIAPDGWTSVKTGAKNSAASYAGDTQITKEAKWSDEEKTVADVKIKAYYTANQQMDFIFVLDCTQSMSAIGNSDVDQYAKFYDMQSKLLDVSAELLSTPGYDCHVAFTGYGEKSSQHFNSGFFTNAADAENYIWNITSYQSLTNLSLGLAEAKTLAEANIATGRATTVVLISDGTPNKNGNFTGYDEGYYGYTEAAAIRESGAQIFGVLHAMQNGVVNDQAKEVMDTICDKYFVSYDTEGFSRAVNDAITAVYGEYVLTDTVDPAFELDAGTIQVSSGTYLVGEDTQGNTTITWTISGMPFTTHTMTFQEKLRQVNGSYPYGTFDTNEGNAELTEDGDPVNTVETPQLPRDNDTPIIPPDTSDPTPDPDPEDPTDIPDENVPEGELPEEPGEEIPDENVPEGEVPEEIPDEDVPQGEAPKTGDLSLLYVALAGVSGLGLAGTCLLGRKKRDEE